MSPPTPPTPPKRPPRPTPEPFPFPDLEGGFRLTWLNVPEQSEANAPYRSTANEGGNPLDRIGLLHRPIPDDVVERMVWLEGYARAHRGEPIRDDNAAPLWHALHHNWVHGREVGVVGFMEEWVAAHGGIEAAAERGGVWISLNALPPQRKPVVFDKPHILLAVMPDGEFTRVLAWAFLGLDALGLSERMGEGRDLGPVSVAVRGIPLNSGVPNFDHKELTDPFLMLLDPLSVVADFGEVDGVDDEGRVLWKKGTVPARLYHPADDPQYGFLTDQQRGYLRLWGGPVPGHVGRVGALQRQLGGLATTTSNLYQMGSPPGDRGGGRRASHPGDGGGGNGRGGRSNWDDRNIPKDGAPVSPVWAQAIEHQFASMRWIREHRPFETVRRQLGMRPVRGDVDAGIASYLEVAQPIYWTEEMSRLLSECWPEAPGEWQLQPEELGPTDGYMWFSEPLPLVEGDPERLRAMLWATQPDGEIVITPFTVYMGPGSDLVRGTFFPPPYQGAPRHLMFWQPGQSLASWVEGAEERFADGRYMREATRISGVVPEIEKGQILAWGKIFAAAITLMAQTIIHLAPAVPDRAGRRRIERLQPWPPKPIPLVRAVLLRRVSTVRPGTADGEHEEVNWHWRWGVRKHWRQQWYPSLGRHKWIIIWPYVKGPANRPLKDDVPLIIMGR